MAATSDPVRIDLPGSGDFSVPAADEEDAVSGTWTLQDRTGTTVAIPEWTAGDTSDLSKRTLAPNQITLMCTETPTYARLTLTATVKFQQAGKPARTATQSWTILFNAVWGGVAKASYPYPVDWGPPCKPWGSDKKGQRALVLMYDLINQMPESLRQTAGAMPIARIDKMPFNIPAGGFDAPYLSDCILITDFYVDLVGIDESGNALPNRTPGDLTFIKVVLHEIGHAATYRRASLGVHQALSPILHALRSLPVLVPSAYAFSYALPILISAIHALASYDFVAGYARVSGWQLASWPLQVLRGLAVNYELIDILSGVRTPTLLPTIYPNVITGYFGVGNIFGLKNDEFAYGMIQRLQSEMAAARDDAFKNPSDSAKQKLYQDKLNELRSALASCGAVSPYATTDVLEDIAEAITAITFTADQLNQSNNGYPYFTAHPDGSVSEGFAKRRQYLEDEQLFPKNWTKLESCAFLRGKEAQDHLDDWQVTF